MDIWRIIAELLAMLMINLIMIVIMVSDDFIVVKVKLGWVVVVS